MIPTIFKNPPPKAEEHLKMHGSLLGHEALSGASLTQHFKEGPAFIMGSLPRQGLGF